MPSSRRPAAGSFFLAPARARAVRPEHGGLVGVHRVAESPGHSTRCLRMPPRGPERGGGRRSRQHPAWPTGHLSRSVTGKPETRVPPARLPGSLSPPPPSPFRGGGAGIQTARRAIEVPFLAMDWAIRKRDPRTQCKTEPRGRRPPPRTGAASPCRTRQHVSFPQTPPSPWVCPHTVDEQRRRCWASETANQTRYAGWLLGAL